MAAGPMKMRATLGQGYTEVRVLMTHPMETGQRKDAEGKLVPMHFIQNLTVKVNGTVVVDAQISQAVSRNPVFSFRLKGGAKGDKIEVEALWKKRQGPKNVSLERCDLGKGPGVLKGAYAGLPRYFKDADRVMDLETRLLYCMTTLQGRTREEATKRVFGSADRPSEFESLSAYIA